MTQSVTQAELMQMPMSKANVKRDLEIDLFRSKRDVGYTGRAAGGA